MMRWTKQFRTHPRREVICNQWTWTARRRRRHTTIDGGCWSPKEAEHGGGGRAEKFAQREESWGRRWIVARAHELGILTSFMASVQLITEAKSPFIASVLKDSRPKAWCWWHFWKFENWRCLYGLGSINNWGRKPIYRLGS